MVQGRLKKNFHKVHETPTYCPMGLIHQRNKGSGSGYPSDGLIFTVFLMKITQF